MQIEPSLAVVVPIRSFTGGKARLAARLDPDARAAFVRDTARRVVAAAGAHPTFVVSSAPEVRTWAADLDVTVLGDPGTLDGAAAAGRDAARATGCARVAIVHADLPLITSLDPVLGGPAEAVTLVPDRFDDGTPVLVVPSAVPFGFAFGPGSFRRHHAEAERHGLEVRIVRDAALAFDVDRPEDLDALDALDGLEAAGPSRCRP